MIACIHTRVNQVLRFLLLHVVNESGEREILPDFRNARTSTRTSQHFVVLCPHHYEIDCFVGESSYTDMEMPIIENEELREWITHFQLNPKLEGILQMMGVEYVDDLDTVFADQGLLIAVRAQLPFAESQKFEQTYHLYKELLKDDGDETSTGYSVNSEDKLAETERLRHAERLKHRVEVLERKLQAAATLDLVIVLDCTGSMEPFIEAAETKIRSFVTSIAKIYPDIELRIGFVGYRDHCDEDIRLAILPFTKSLEEFECFLAVQPATGGGDGPEDIVGALQAANRLGWMSELRVLFHIGDYPCHGLEYHDNLPDDYPQGDPYGLQPVTFLQSLSQKKVRYLFGELTHKTDKMLQRFRELLGFDYIRAEPMRDVTMMTVITSSVSSIITDSLSHSSSTSAGAADGHMKDCALDTVPPPDWDLLPTEKVVSFAMITPTSLDTISNGEMTGVLNDFPDIFCCYIKCAQRPFAKGSNKLAYRALLVDTSFWSGTQTTEKVLKESTRANKSHQTKEKFEEHIATQRAALYLTEGYNAARPANSATIEFAPIRLLQFLARPNRPYFIEESYIPGAWERYNNNTGYCAPFPTPLGTHHEAVQAFSHWTHHVSGDRLMITDCQGCFDAARNAFVLTDPAVHCVSLLAYGGTNMGAKGFERFFKTHRCNDICRAMQLTPPTISLA